MVSRVFEKLVNNRIADHVEKCGLFSDFEYGFRSSQSTTDLFTAVSDRIARTFNRFWVRHLALFLLFSVIDGFDWFWMKRLDRNIKLVLEFLRSPLLVP